MSGFEEHLKEARTRAGLSQPELAAKVDVDKSYISKLERGVESPPSRKVAVKLADALGMRNKPVTLYISTEDMAELERFTFLLEAEVVGAEDVQEIKQAQVNKGQEPGGGQQLRRRRSGALASPQIEKPRTESGLDDSTTVGQEIDEILKGLAPEEHARLREILVSIARYLVRLEKLHTGGLT